MSETVKVALPKGMIEAVYGDIRIQADHDGNVTAPSYVAKALVAAGATCSAKISSAPASESTPEEIGYFINAHQRHARHPDVRRKYAAILQEHAGDPPVSFA